MFHAAEPDGDTPSFPPRICRPRIPQRAPISCTVNDSEADSASSFKQMVEAVTAAAIAADDRHLAHMGLCPAPTVPYTDPVAITAPPTAAASRTVPHSTRSAPVAPYTGPVTHPTYPAMTSPGTVLPSVAPRTVPPFARSAPKTPYTGPVTHPTYPATTSPGTAFPSVASRPVPPSAAARTIPPVAPYTGPVTHLTYTTTTSPDTIHPFTSSGSMHRPPHR